MYIATRNEGKTKRAIEELKEQTGHEAVFLMLDLSDLLSVKHAAEEFLRYVWAYRCFSLVGVVLTEPGVTAKKASSTFS